MDGGGGGVAGLLFSIVFIKYIQSQHKSGYEDNQSDANAINNVDVKDDDARSSEETLKMTNASIIFSESVPILQ